MAEQANNVNFMALLNPDFAAKQMAFQQQQQLAQQMMQEGSQQPENAQLANPGGLVIPNSPFAAAGKALEKGLGGYLSGRAQAGQLNAYKDLAAQMNPQAQASDGTGSKMASVMMNDPSFMQNAMVSGVDNATKVWLAQNSPTDLAKNAVNPVTAPYLAKDQLINVNGHFMPATDLTGNNSPQISNTPQPAQPASATPQPPAMVNGQPQAPANLDELLNAQSNVMPNKVTEKPIDFNNPIQVDAAKKAAETANTESAKSGSDYQNKLIDDSSHALEGKRIMGQMTENLKGFEPGKLAAAKADLSAWGQALGFDKKTLDASVGSVGDVQSFNKLTAQLAIQAIKQISPRATQMEFQRFLENNPNVELNPDAMKTLMDYTSKTFDLPLQKQQEFSKWKKNNPLSSYADFDSEWNNKINSDIGSTISQKSDQSAPKIIKYDATGKRVQ